MIDLPKLEHPLFNITIPSTQKVVKFRPYLVKEEKILLIARESKSIPEIVEAIKQIITVCAAEAIDLNQLTTFDLEFLFIRLVAISVNNMLKLGFLDHDDKKTYDFDVDLNKVEVVFPENHENTIKLTDRIGIKLKYPSANIPTHIYGQLDNAALLFEIIKTCLDKVYDGEQIFNFKDYTSEQIDAFLDDLPPKAIDQFKEFFTTMPALYHKIEYKNANDLDRSIELKTLDDFFTLG